MYIKTKIPVDLVLEADPYLHQVYTVSVDKYEMNLYLFFYFFVIQFLKSSLSIIFFLVSLLLLLLLFCVCIWVRVFAHAFLIGFNQLNYLADYKIMYFKL